MTLSCDGTVGRPFAVRVLLLGGAIAWSACSYPTVVKNAAAEQVRALQEMRATASALSDARASVAEESLAMTNKAALAASAVPLLKTGCPKGAEDCVTLMRDQLVASLGESSRTSTAAIVKERARWNQLDLQLQFLERGASLMNEYVTTDITLSDDEIKNLEEAAQGLNAPQSGSAQ